MVEEVKPMAESTLHASITELFPLIAWEKNIVPSGNVNSFYNQIQKVDLRSLSCLLTEGDYKAAVKVVTQAPSSSKFQTKVEDAMNFYKFIKQEERGASIDKVFWGYRTKPIGVSSYHKGDIFLKFRGGEMLGVSLKAGTKNSKEPKLNTYVNKIFETFRKDNYSKRLRHKLHREIYSKIYGMPDINSYDVPLSESRKKTKELLVKLNDDDNVRYEKLYDQQLEICRKAIIDLFNEDPKKTKQYIRTAILAVDDNVPTKVIKSLAASGGSFRENNNQTLLDEFLPKVKRVKAYASSSSKQDWFIELKSNNKTKTMEMSIRTNKGGDAGNKKLGQFYNLSVKYKALINN